jgi:hypothetical protein
LERPLFPLYDTRWGYGPLLGASPPVRGTAFAAAADWRPVHPDAAVRFYGLGRERFGAAAAGPRAVQRDSARTGGWLSTRTS